MKFAMLSDTHYISPRMILDKSDKELLLQPEVTRQALLQAAEQADTIFITGDLTDRGDRLSHEDFVELLREIKSRGKKIYVIFATHDFNHHRAYVRKYGDTKARFKAEPWQAPYFEPEAVCWRDYVTEDCRGMSEEECTPQLVEALSPEQVWEMYREFGANEAVSVSESDFSYCVELEDGTRCLMLNDLFRNEEALEDKSPTFTPKCFKWISSQVRSAKNEGKSIFVCSHHPFIPCTPAHRIGTDNRNLRSPLPAHTLADMGIELAFVGHTHGCYIGFAVSDKGNSLCNIETPSVRFYPPVFRLCELNGEKKTLKHRCIDVKIPQGVRLEEPSLREHYRLKMYREYYQKLESLPAPLNKILAEATLKRLVFFFGKGSGLTPDERKRLSEKKLFDFLSEVVFNMLTGDGAYTPQTAEYKLLMHLSAIGDSIIDTQPFADIRTKYLKGYTLCRVFGALLFKQGISDCEGEFDFSAVPEEMPSNYPFASRAGDIFIAAVCTLALPLSLLAPLGVGVGIPLLTLKKKHSLKKHPAKVVYRY